MRAGLVLGFVGAVAAVAAIGRTHALAALDNEQFCKAMVEIARLSQVDAGRWIDRNTRDDGIEVLCNIRTVNYKRFIKAGAQAADWKARKQFEWNSIACNSAVLREAIDAGWIITSTIVTVTGERALVIATCK